MTDQPQPRHSAPRRRRPRVYRTALGIALAALLAAWLPFSILYVNALTNPALVVATKSGPVLRTTASGSVQAVTTSGGQAPQPVHAVAPVTTRTS